MPRQFLRLPLLILTVLPGAVTGVLAALCVSSCAAPVRSPPSAARAQIVLRNVTGYDWLIDARQEHTREQHQWQLAPRSTTTVQLAAGSWHITQALPATGEARTVEVTLSAGVTYEWPLATLHAAGDGR